MDKHNTLIIWILLAEVLLAVASNFLFLRISKDGSDREYRVSIMRITQELESKEGILRFAENENVYIDNDSYPHIISVKPFDPYESSNNDYAVIKGADGNLYRVSYSVDTDNSGGLVVLNLVWGATALFTIIAWIYISKKILKPFRDISGLPAELARGNLTIPVKEEKNRYFGRFLWGMDNLREKLEHDNADRLRMEQEKKTLVLSISHDIKTPISAIKLYNKALSEGLYDTEEKKLEAHQGIERNLNELEKYVDEIRETSRDDFMTLKVKDGEWYLSEVINKLNALYSEKAIRFHTDFTINEYSDCILKGDQDRGLEVLQNIMENALKYGDGRRIVISFSDEEDCRLVSIENSGCSLPEKELNNIFDSFYRGSNSDNKSGSGLGLYICRQLMNAMDGDIFADIKNDCFVMTAVFRKC